MYKMPLYFTIKSPNKYVSMNSSLHWNYSALFNEYWISLPDAPSVNDGDMTSKSKMLQNILQGVTAAKLRI